MSRKKKHLVGARLGVESLETRSLLSALHGAAALHSQADAHRPAWVGTAHAGQSHGQGGEHSATLLTTKLTDTDGTAIGSARFATHQQHGTTVSTLTVQVRDAAPGTPLDVSIDGTSIGTITPDAEGEGRLVLSSNPHGEQQPLPTTLTITSGSVVTVGTATGTFAMQTKTDHGHHHESTSGENQGDAHKQVVTQLSGQLTNADSTLTGFVRYMTRTGNGKTSSQLQIHVEGATPGATLDVSVVDSNGTTVSLGQITADEDGEASLTLFSNPHGSQQGFPDGFVGLADGSVVTVADATGTLKTKLHD